MMKVMGTLAAKVSLPAVSEENTIVDGSYRVSQTDELCYRYQAELFDR